MTNLSKYKTWEDLAAAYYRDIHDKITGNAYDEAILKAFKWLDAEAREDILPCPFCGKKCWVDINHRADNAPHVRCSCCGYVGCHTATVNGAIARHNEIARLVKDKKTRLGECEVCNEVKNGGAE